MLPIGREILQPKLYHQHGCTRWLLPYYKSQLQSSLSDSYLQTTSTWSTYSSSFPHAGLVWDIVFSLMTLVHQLPAYWGKTAGTIHQPLFFSCKLNRVLSIHVLGTETSACRGAKKHKTHQKIFLLGTYKWVLKVGFVNVLSSYRSLSDHLRMRSLKLAAAEAAKQKLIRKLTWHTRSQSSRCTALEMRLRTSTCACRWAT